MRMMDLNDLYINALADFNTQQGGILRPYLNFNQWLNDISTELFNEKFGDAEKSQENNDQLDNAFLKSLNVVVTAQPGKNFDMITLPADYGYFAAIRVFTTKGGDTCGCAEYDVLTEEGQCKKYTDPDLEEIRERLKGENVNETKAEKVDNGRFGAACKHKLLTPTLALPFVTQVNGGLKIVPRDIGIVILDYYRLPAKAVYAYTTTGVDTVNYNLGGSTQLDWPDLVKPEFLARLKKRYGSATRNQDQYVEGEQERKQTKI